MGFIEFSISQLRNSAWINSSYPYKGQTNVASKRWRSKEPPGRCSIGGLLLAGSEVGPAWLSSSVFQGFIPRTLRTAPLCSPRSSLSASSPPKPRRKILITFAPVASLTFQPGKVDCCKAADDRFAYVPTSSTQNFWSNFLIKKTSKCEILWQTKPKLIVTIKLMKHNTENDGRKKSNVPATQQRFSTSTPHWSAGADAPVRHCFCCALGLNRDRFRHSANLNPRGRRERERILATPVEMLHTHKK